MSRILLLTTSFEENRTRIRDKDTIRKEDAKTHYPIGLACLHSYAESKGHDIRTLSFNSYPYWLCYHETDKNIQEFKPDILGLQVLTQNRTSAFHTIERTRRDHPHIRIVLGGIHATLMYKQILEKYPFVTVVLGEGEETFMELLERGSSADVKGIAYHDGEKVVVTEKRELIPDLDALPFPKHELFFDEYRDCACIMTTRGCPFNCSFCALESVSKRVHRVRSVENVIAEIEEMIGKFPNLKKIWIHDDTFFLNNKRVIEFCDEVVKRGIKVEFIASGRLKPLSMEMVRKLEEANFTRVLFGLESGTDEILWKAHKGITQKDAEEAFRLFSKVKVKVTTFLIVGLPGETWDTVMTTARFVKKLQKIKYTTFVDIGVLVIYPGTEIYRLACEAGQLDDSYWMTEKPVPFYTAEHTEEELMRMKEVTLNHISLFWLKTVEGLKAQWDVVPHVLNYVLETKIGK